MEHSSESLVPSARSDLISGSVWMVIGIAISIGSWNMDRLEGQGVRVFAAPGLVPGLLGVFIFLTALAIALRAWRRGALGSQDGDLSPRGQWSHVAMALVLCLGFAVVLVGHGLPFWVAASTYLFLHIFLLQLPERRLHNEVKRGLVVAASVGLTAGVSVALLFQYVFLVRLP